MQTAGAHSGPYRRQIRRARGADHMKWFGKRHGTAQHRLGRPGHRGYRSGPNSDRECRAHCSPCRQGHSLEVGRGSRSRESARSLARRRSAHEPDVSRLIDDEEVEIVVELMGGIEPALQVVLDSLRAGKHVVTANKALLAEHGPRIFAQARAADRAVAFEASVGGGIPIVQALGVSLAANQIQNLAAILNGTCNYILTKMTLEGLPYDEALAQAQALGYAEADPTLDVDGTDTAHKLAILSQLAFQSNIKTDAIPRQGIDRLQLADLKYAGELGYAVKLLALAKLSPAGLELRVAPTLVRRGTPLAEVRGPYNAIRVVGDAVGDTFFYGLGAGMMPTASAVIGDLIDVVTGRALVTSRVLNLWAQSARSDPPRIRRPDHQPVLPALHHRRSTRRAGRACAGAG